MLSVQDGALAEYLSLVVLDVDDVSHGRIQRDESLGEDASGRLKVHSQRQRSSAATASERTSDACLLIGARRAALSRQP